MIINIQTRQREADSPKSTPRFSTKHKKSQVKKSCRADPDTKTREQLGRKKNFSLPCQLCFGF